MRGTCLEVSSIRMIILGPPVHGNCAIELRPAQWSLTQRLSNVRALVRNCVRRCRMKRSHMKQEKLPNHSHSAGSV